MQRCFYKFFIFILIYFLTIPVVQAQDNQVANTTQLVLTQEEQQYIQQHPDISIAIDIAWAPYGFLKDTYECGGIIPNIMQLVADRAGLKVHFVSKDSYIEAIKACRDGETTLVSGIANDPTMATKNDVLITIPYMDVGYSAVTKKQITNLYGNNAHYKVAICKGTYAQMHMERQMATCQFITYNSNLECMNAVRNGEADIALIANYSVGYFHNFQEFNTLQIISINDFDWQLCFGVNKDVNPILISILNKSIATITNDDLNHAIFDGATEATIEARTIWDIIYDQPILVTTFLILVGVIISVILFLQMNSKSNAIAYDREQKLRAKAEAALELAEQANMAKTEFLSRVSHDMRTPMNGILGITQLSAKETDITVLRDNLQKVEYLGKYMLSLINDTLDLQKIQSGKLTLNLQPISLDMVLESINTMISVTAAKKGVVFTINCQNFPQDTLLLMDEVRIKQICVNLLSNAIKFTNPGGKVSLDVNVFGKEAGSYRCLVIVKDNGLGMSEHFIKHELFKPFSQEYNSYSNQYAGSGLGLSIVKNLVEMMNGKIEVTSELNKGTEFKVYLNLPEANSKEVAHKIRQKAKTLDEIHQILNDKKILLVEDHPMNAEIARRILENQGCEILWANNGQKGLDAFKNSQENEFDAILMDMRMPIMDGLEATKRIRSLHRQDATTIPIIAMTANAFAEDVQNCLDAGMNVHISKPVNVKNLYQTLASVIHNNVNSN